MNSIIITNVGIYFQGCAFPTYLLNKKLNFYFLTVEWIMKRRGDVPDCFAWLSGCYYHSQEKQIENLYNRLAIRFHYKDSSTFWWQCFLQLTTGKDISTQDLYFRKQSRWEWPWNSLATFFQKYSCFVISIDHESEDDKADGHGSAIPFSPDSYFSHDSVINSFQTPPTTLFLEFSLTRNQCAMVVNHCLRQTRAYSSFFCQPSRIDSNTHDI